MTSRFIIPAGQVFVMEATFTDADTGVPANPTEVVFSVTRMDTGGRYVVESYTWSGVDIPNVTNESAGVFRGIYTPPSYVQEFQAKMVGTGAVVGGAEAMRVLIVP